MAESFATAMLTIIQEMVRQPSVSALLHYSMESAVDLLQADQGQLALWDDDGLMVQENTADTAVNGANEILHRAARQNRACLTSSPTDGAAMMQLCVPLCAYGDPLGALLIERRAPAFSQTDCDHLMLLAAQIAAHLKAIQQADTKQTPILSPFGELEHFQELLLNSVDQAIVATDVEGNIFLWNDFAAQLYGWTASEVTGKSVEQILVPRPTAEQVAAIMTTLQGGERWVGEFQVQRRDGSVFPAWVVNSPIFDKHGNLVGIVGVSQDISELRHTQSQVEHSSVVNAALAELSKALFQSKTLADISALVLDYASRLTGSLTGYAGYVDPATGYLICTTLNNDLWLADKQAGNRIIFKTWQGLEGWVLDNKTALLMNDPADDPRTVPPDENTPLPQRFLSVPVLDGERLIGQITLANAGHDYMDADQKLVERLAVLYGAALLRQHAEEEERQQRALSEALRDIMAAITQTLNLDEVFKHILTRLGDVVPYDAANLMLVQDNMLRVAHCLGYAERGLEEWLLNLRIPLDSRPTLASSFHEQRSLIIPDPHDNPLWENLPEDEWIRSFANSPICFAGNVLGFINLCSSTPHFFTEEHAGRLRIFADQAAIAIQNAALFEAERRKRVLAQTFQKIAETITVSNRLDDTLKLALELLGNIVAYDHAEVLLVEGNNLRVIAANCQTCPPIDANSQLIKRPYVEIPAYYEPMTQGAPLVLLDADTDERWPQDIQRGCETRGWLGVPLVVWDVVLGLLSISSHQPGAYDDTEVEATQAFARQVALAIENSHLYTQLETSQASLRQVRAHLTQTARLSVAGKIAAGVAHQINNPLTTVVAQTHLLLKRLPPESPSYEAAETIRRATYRAGTVVQRLMDFARPSSYIMEPLDLNRTILNVISLVRAQVEPHIARITVDLAPDLPPFQGSEEHLEDVWINLILNARDAIDGSHDGHIHITTRYLPNHNTIKVIVDDNGSGIAAEHLSVIFDPLFTTKEYGTGLGLAVCHDIIVDHGGTIQVASQERQGATFTILLPA